MADDKTRKSYSAEELIAMTRAVPEVRAVATKYILVHLPLDGGPVDEEKHRPPGSGWRLTNTAGPRATPRGPAVVLEWTRFLEIHRRAN